MLTVTYNRKCFKEDLYNCVFCSLSITLIGSVGGEGLSDLVAQLVGASTPGMCRAEHGSILDLAGSSYQYHLPFTVRVRSLVLCMSSPYSKILSGYG